MLKKKQDKAQRKEERKAHATENARICERSAS